MSLERSAGVRRWTPEGKGLETTDMGARAPRVGMGVACWVSSSDGTLSVVFVVEGVGGSGGGSSFAGRVDCEDVGGCGRFRLGDGRSGLVTSVGAGDECSRSCDKDLLNLSRGDGLDDLVVEEIVFVAPGLLGPAGTAEVGELTTCWVVGCALLPGEGVIGEVETLGALMGSARERGSEGWTAMGIPSKFWYMESAIPAWDRVWMGCDGSKLGVPAVVWLE